jgi:hypothetical protein
MQSPPLPDPRIEAIQALRRGGQTEAIIADMLDLTPRSLRRIAGARSAALAVQAATDANEPNAEAHEPTGRDTAAPVRSRARVFLTDDHGIYRYAHQGDALSEHEPGVEVGEIGDPDGSGRRLRLLSRHEHDLGIRSAFDHYSGREFADRQARQRGAAYAIEIGPDGSYVQVEL